MTRIDFTSLSKAIASLANALQVAKLRPKDEFVRDAKELHARLDKAAK